MSNFTLGEYLYGGIEKIIKGAMKSTLSNPKESVFLAKFALTAKKAAKIRHTYEEKKIHVPAFLIASITTKCNLHCAGCYARANHSCFDEQSKEQMTSLEWKKVFDEACDIGVSFILLAGGEPFIRKDVIEEASKHKDIIFPIFTNGSMFNEEYYKIYNDNRNLVPILSIEGLKEATDIRRGEGTYDRLVQTMEELKKKGILYGVSVTVTKQNQAEVMSEKFSSLLVEKGCKVVIYVEYVPVDETTKALALEDDDRKHMEEALTLLRKEQSELVYVSFPGDEKTSGGCLAAGRGFFHINAMGGAEPCPFSPYSDCSVREGSLLEALQSPLFNRLRSEDVLMKEHIGGCVLFEQRDIVEKLVKG